MYKLSLIILFVASTMVSCTPPSDDTIETWWINSAKVDCVGVGPMTCLQVQKNVAEPDPEAWTLFYDGIKGFDYQAGKIYQIKVRITDREAPLPQDVSSKIYELVEVVSQNPDPSLRITNIWKVTSVGEIENPTKVNSEEPLIFEFNASAKTYFGDMSCNSVRGAIQTNDGKSFTLGPGAATMMACMDMTVENQISNALQEVRSYEIADRELRFFNESGDKLMTFQAVD
ncbi:DUF4377 domain-containing protein [Algoriphagus namhaensis]|uniref:DUF4377 domain-containing protein n=1 Tax=Algoriphagus namhaensis TaxID=915353 RepID=A0ABV8AXF0_9BACT